MAEDSKGQAMDSSTSSSSFMGEEKPVWQHYCDIHSIIETCKENLRLQQEKDDLKTSFLHSESTRMYLEYIGKDTKLWPSVKDTEAKLAVSTKNRQDVKEAFEEEKDKIKDILQLVNAECTVLQEKKQLLEEKQKVFENKKAMFESKMKIKPEMAKVAIQKCKQAIEKLQKEVETLNTKSAALERSISDLQSQLRLQKSQKGNNSAEQMISRAKEILAFMESLTEVKVGTIENDRIHFHFNNTTHNQNRDCNDEELNLTLTVSVQTSIHGNLQLTGVHTNIENLKIQDLADVAIATNDLPYLIRSVKDRWNHHFPLLSEIDILIKHHAVDWIEEQSRLRVLVGKCGRVMFTLNVPKDYPTCRKITLLDSYGVDNLDHSKLPDESATLLQWVKFLETNYGD